MSRSYPRFDRSRLRLRPLAEREHLLDLSVLLNLDLEAEGPSEWSPRMESLAGDILQARRRGAPVILFMGAHLLRAGTARYIVHSMERGILTHVAMNGAGPIHDYEFALIGSTTESVGRYIAEGQFGLWEETGQINQVVKSGLERGEGFGEAVGHTIWAGNLPFRDVSVLAAGYRLGIPTTVHIGIGYDIIHEHPSCDAAALGQASYEDFLILAETVRHLEGGVVLSFGSAVMAPEVFLKALAMARNVAHSEGRQIRCFTTAVFDLVDLGGDLSQEAPRTEARYYFRPFKTMLVRTVNEGGRSLYFQGDHRETFPALCRLVHRGSLEDR